MHASLRACLPFALLALVACSPKQPDAAATPSPTMTPTTPAASTATAPADDKKCTNEPKTDPNDKRPRCGGTGTPPASTAAHAYRIDSVTCPGGGHESIQACDITKPFTNTVCGGMADITHTPTSDRGGTWSFVFRGAGGTADSNGTYTLSGSEASLTEHVVGNKICVHAGGRTICTTPRSSTSTWTKIASCTQ